MTKQLLDHNRIVMARLELNLSQRDVAFEVGIHPVTMFRLEQGRSDATLSLGTIDRLAAALAAPDLHTFRQPGTSPQPGGSPTPDERRLEALLCDARTSLSADDIAVAFGWTLPRAYAALSALKRGLANRGTTVFSSARRHPPHGPQRSAHHSSARAPRASTQCQIWTHAPRSTSAATGAPRGTALRADAPIRQGARRGGLSSKLESSKTPAAESNSPEDAKFSLESKSVRRRETP